MNALGTPLTFAFAALLALGACSSDASRESATTSPSATSDATADGDEIQRTTVDDPSLLFVQTAPAGELVETDGEIRLRLDDPHQSVLWFTDRPDRTAGTLPLDAFETRWHDNGFDDDPPNAAIEWVLDGAASEPIAFELSTPQYEGTTLTYDLTLIDEGTALPTGRVLRDVTVLIDSVATGYISGTVTLQTLSGDPISGVTVELKGTTGAGQALGESTRTDGNGRFAFGVVPYGSYTLTLSKGGYQTVVTDVSLTPPSVGIDLTAPMDFSPGSGGGIN